MAEKRGQDGGKTDQKEGLRDRARELGGQVREGAEHVGERVREGFEATRSGVTHRYRRAEGMMARHPGSSVLIGFGVGFGLGVLLSAMMTSNEEESWYGRHVPDSLRDLPDQARRLARRAGHRLRDVPEAVMQYMPDSFRS
jgi:ElaB/YqjD/DUF883 family membrane-anchored ribosome-binding protein